MSTKTSSIELKHLSHIKIGGKADLLYFPSSTEELFDLYRTLIKNHPIFFIGGASNTLFGNVKNTALISDKELPWKWIQEDNLVILSSNHNINHVIKKASKFGLGGLEFLAGIPAHLGGITYMNAGAYHKCIADYIEWIKVLDENGVNIIKKENIHFAYRSSNIKGLILEVAIRFDKADPLSISNKIIEKINLRREKQPLTTPNLGCFFKNGMNYTSGQIIDELKLKGFAVGDAMVSYQHANFLVNNGNAKFSDMLELINKIKNIVLEKKNISLDLEVKIVNEN